MAETDFDVVALDLDGTVLNSAGNVTETFCAAVHALKKLGVRTVLCTGRRWRTAVEVIEQVEHADPTVVCCGGALIKEGESHRTLHTLTLEPDTARRTASLFRSAGLVPLVLRDQPIEGRELLIAEGDRNRAGELAFVQRNVMAVEYFEGAFPEEPVEILEVFTVDDVATVRGAEAPIGDALGADAIVVAMHQPRYGPRAWVIEVHGPTATKWSALSWLLKRWQVPSARVVAMGDDVNDVPMLQAAGLSFAMRNAVPEAKAVADRVTAGNDEDGVVQALRSVFPIC